MGNDLDGAPIFDRYKKVDNLEGVVIRKPQLAYKPRYTMPDDQHVQLLIQEAQEATNKPMTFKDLKPHERAMLLTKRVHH